MIEAREKSKHLANIDVTRERIFFSFFCRCWGGILLSTGGNGIFCVGDAGVYYGNSESGGGIQGRMGKGESELEESAASV